jgi:pimeloyl-ACP methyl ester carboxylesterase
MVGGAILFISPFAPAYWRRLIRELGGVAGAEFVQTGQYESVELEAENILKNLQKDVSLVAACMGGYVALELCTRRPSMIRGVALLAVPGGVDDDERRGRRMALIKSLEAKVARGDRVRDKDTDTLLPWMLGRAAMADRETVKVAREALANPFGVVLRQQIACGARAAPRLDATISRSRIIALIGDQDRISPRASADELAFDLTGSSADTIRSCGHLLAIERPRETAEALLRILPAEEIAMSRHAL